MNPTSRRLSDRNQMERIYYIIYTIYRKYRKRQSLSLLLEERTVVTWEWVSNERRKGFLRYWYCLSTWVLAAWHVQFAGYSTGYINQPNFFPF